MSDKTNNINEGPGNTGDEQAINQKLDELIALLAETNIDSDKARNIQQRLNHAIENSAQESEGIEALRQIDTDNASRDDLLDEFSILLSSHQFDSEASKKYIRAEKGANIVLMIISLVLITLGLAMIVMPAPPDFEIYTIFFFNPNDGITVMDLISSLIVLSGIYLFIKSLFKSPVNPKQ
ncbi:hypothetical protein LJ707_00590 [Mucilaginibacter sp. UR6-1]|uniref:hypothetical protein n=1 Tax=Mucilaginibacter sp. UR6-1 TaxID=1435643 RepID=UPI001E3FCE02|nr:hypothetical protein [Mucilaginibacter sp. UR6-1]MCC8407409.1 hypothetical protein [Mucilaginibacter sp. UR6-1]